MFAGNMGYLLAVTNAITLNRFSTFNPLIRYFSSQIIKPNKWWRPGTEDSAINEIRPYNISFSEELVKDLKYKVRNSEIFVKPKLEKDRKKEMNMYTLCTLLRQWGYNYNFQEREKYINSNPHFITNVQGLDIHFIHIKPHVKKCNVKKRYMPLPLLLLHGWPSSVIEFYKDISLEKSREIIIPSLPGFGFSSAPTISGFSCIDMSVVLKNLMLKLGHDKFYVIDDRHDAINSYIMSMLFPQHAYKDYSIFGYNNAYRERDYFFSEFTKKIVPVEKLLKKFGYLEDQASEINKTDNVSEINTINKAAEMNTIDNASEIDTIKIDLKDSPDALAAYFMEIILNRPSSKAYLTDEQKMHFYMETIDNLMMYWAPQCINTAIQVYDEQFKNLPNEFFKLLNNF
ncbi:juvenile hormone epoxide hydrolase-like [Nylanderia fulva]|uniref:juvenile hormone epoxide hydrolase-like n=1 Tax=Nylanderia fulva TaxID=613905 RepID=UPI0010FB6C65|nr:juvenile hormone epoxide hydrolase-like [Nylanderia fulva]